MAERTWDRTTDWTNYGDNVVPLHPLVVTPAPMPDPVLIHPREWLYGTSLVRKYVSMLVAPGGVGKTALMLTTALSLASGRSLLGDVVHKRCRIWLYNGDDPTDELDRRIAAAMSLHNLTRADLDGWLFRDSGRDRRFCMMTQTDDGAEVQYPDKDALAAHVRGLDIGCVFIDPFVKAHAINENDNGAMDLAASAWAEVAQTCNCAVSLVHHTRKGLVTDVDAARGGKALTDAARVTQILTPMTVIESKQLGVAEEDRWQYCRLDDAKVNLAPRAGCARWYHLVSVALGNCSDEYPSGDHVAAMQHWIPPSAFDGMPMGLVIDVLDQIDEGPGGGIRWHSDKRGASGRWAGQVLMEAAGKSEVDAARIVRAWLASGLLVPTDYRDKEARKLRHGVAVDKERLGDMRTQWLSAHNDNDDDAGS